MIWRKNKNNAFLDYAEFETAKIRAIVKDIVLKIFYTVYVIAFVRFPELLWELVSFKGFILFYVYWIAKTGVSLADIPALLTAVGVSVYKIKKDLSKPAD
ncbi:MAG TPA: hypothetical protein DHW82_14235 [Spirochaetia bacterium]|nr:MAG: hypothetical protein A2Y41_00375 [Spirochaetes bacterium GWB1_36_13]HCL58149.1 hypothetical protein [Spirochaetia bacterium]